MPGRNVTVCTGVSGFGKSTINLRWLVNADLSVRFLFDPDAGEFNPDCGEYADRLGLEPAHDLHTLNLSLCRGWVAFDPHTLFPGRMQEAFQFFCEWAWECSAKIPGNKVIVIDEAWNYCSPQTIPRELQTICQSGRKRGLHCWLNTQEPHRLNGTILGGVSEMICFRLQHTRALEVVAEKGFDPSEVASLEPRQFVARNLDSGGELRGTIKL